MKRLKHNFAVLCYLLIILCSLFLPLSLHASTTAEEIDTLLQTSEVTYAQAARFILEASDRAVFADNTEAFRYAQELNWLPEDVSAAQTARLDVVSALFMNAFDIKGGIFYTLTGRPHYAYRELVYLNHIQGRTEPSMKVSGEQLLFITTRILAAHDGALQ